MTSKSGKVSTSDFEIKKRQPQKPTNAESNVFYITRKASISSQVKKLHNMLLNCENEVILYGMGAVINQALRVTIEVEKMFNGAVEYGIKTSTIQVTDDLFPLSDEYEAGIRSRPLSLVQITFRHKVSSI